jgi:hypothetical protein
MSDTLRFRVKRSLRPIKLAFLVAAHDRMAIKQAIALNTHLWGGLYNPIIPVHTRLPADWLEPHLPPRPVRELLAGFVEAFDPDFVVNMGVDPKIAPAIGFRSVIKPSDIIKKNSMGEEDTHYGIPYYDVLDEFYERELKFVRRDPLNVVIPTFERRYELFLSSVFGTYPSSNDGAWLRKHFGAKDCVETLQGFGTTISDNHAVFPRRISSLFISSRPNAWWMYRNAILVMDALNLGDILDYWNLRALGWSVIPLPIQAFDSEQLQTPARAFLRRHCVKDRFNPQIIYHAIMLRGRSVGQPHFEKVCRDVSVSIARVSPSVQFATQNWFPRFWDGWARDRDHCACDERYSEEGEVDVASDENRLSFRVIAPRFLGTSPFGDYRYANEIELKTFESSRPVAEVFPEGSAEVSSAFSYFPSGHNWRLASSGLVFLGRDKDESVLTRVPESQHLMKKWFESNGWTTDTSSAGKMILQSFKQLGGKYWISLLANRGLIEFLRGLSDGKPLLSGVVWQKLKALPLNFGGADASATLENLIRVGLLKLGITVQCPTCTRDSWHAMSDLDYNVRCSFCGEAMVLPTHKPDELRWSYLGISPLCSPSRSDGATSVLLTLRYFSLIHDLPTTPAFGLSLSREGLKCEVDLAAFAKWDPWGRAERTSLILAECKTAGEFGKDDVRKMASLAERFAGALIVFATLREGLSAREIRLLTRLANKGRRLWKRDQPYSPVMILTGTELVSSLPGLGAWQQKGGKHDEMASALRRVSDPIRLCDATQQLYLGMKPWQEWLREKWETKIRRKARRIGPPLSERADSADSI